MKLRINGEIREVEKAPTLFELLKRLDITEKGVAVSVNGEVVVRSLLKEQRLRPGDSVEIVRPVGGG